MLVIGNGESRQSINIDLIDDLKIGCNAIIRDYNVDHLVCVDRRMVKEAVDRNVNQTTYIYTRSDWMQQFKQNKRVREVPELPYVGSDRWDEPFQWGSGPYAVLLGSKLSKHREVRLIGFDLYSKTDTINNVYKSTSNYDDESKRPIDPRYWIHQISMVFKNFPSTHFIIYQDEQWILPKQWKFSNVSLDKISNIV